MFIFLAALFIVKISKNGVFSVPKYLKNYAIFQLMVMDIILQPLLTCWLFQVNRMAELKFNVILFGSPGVGKTCILKQWVSNEVWIFLPEVV